MKTSNAMQLKQVWSLRSALIGRTRFLDFVSSARNDMGGVTPILRLSSIQFGLLSNA